MNAGNVPYRAGHTIKDVGRETLARVSLTRSNPGNAGIVTTRFNDSNLRLESCIDTLFSESISIDECVFTSVDSLSDEAKRSLSVPNAGGKSALSEALSIDYFNKRLGSFNTIDEMMVPYTFEYKMVDFLTTVYGKNTLEIILGVSVTRGMGYPRERNFTSLTAKNLLAKKLSGLVLARNSIRKSHRFFHGVLHIFCQSRRIADIILGEYNNITEEWNDGVCKFKVILTVCSDDRVYYNLRK